MTTTNGSNGFRVAQLIETDGPGGAEQIVVMLARSLQETGASPVVFLPPGREGWITRQLAGMGIEVDHFHLERPLSPRCARLLAEAFERHHITVAHSHEFSMAVYGAWAAHRAGIPHIITMHGSRYYAQRLRRRLALRAAVLASAHTIAVSNGLAQALRRDLWVARATLEMIPNGVPYAPPARITLRDELGLGPHDRLLVSIGSLYPVKGHRHAIEAVALLADLHPRLHLAIGGRGHLRDELSAQSRERGVGHRVHLLGLRSDVPALLAAADVFVLPSLSEGLPLALLEAMFSACAIVATSVGEVPAVLDHGQAGALVEPGNPAALASAIDRLLGDPVAARAMGARAAARAIAEFDATRMLRRYLDIYKAV
jgi:glycosyltransferase involved in cell wall biosynthesis